MVNQNKVMPDCYAEWLHLLFRAPAGVESTMKGEPMLRGSTRRDSRPRIFRPMSFGITQKRQQLFRDIGEYLRQRNHRKCSFG